MMTRGSALTAILPKTHSTSLAVREKGEGGREALRLVAAVLCAATVAGTAAAQAGSNATNYGSEAQLSVSERPGDITVASTLVRLPGVVSELGVSVTLTYRSDDARSHIQSNTRHFGLPYGWSLGISFIYDDGTSMTTAHRPS